LHKLDQVKRALSENKPVIISIGVDAGFHSLAAPFIWKAATAGAAVALHAMVVTGYDDTHSAFRIMNSWGTGWGDNGFAWIDYDFFVKSVVGEGYVVI
jgi:uncharacterized protein YvpB